MSDDAYNQLVNSWLEYVNVLSTLIPIIPSLGMVQTYRKRIVEIGKELTLIHNSIIKFNEYLPKYNQHILNTWFEATTKALVKCERENIKDKEEIKKTWIDTLETEFAKLFNSDEFGSVSGKLLNSENEINTHITKLIEIYSKTLNIPTRSEIDDIYGEIIKLKREVKKLSDRLKTLEGSLQLKGKN